MSVAKKVIVILGATGAQGGSVVQTFLHLQDQYHVRAVTRNLSTKKAQDLTQLGVEVIAANTSNLVSLKSAFTGAHIIFGTTDFWGIAGDPASQAKADEAGKGLMEWTYEVELAQGKNIVQAAAQTEGLERLIYSGLADVSKWSGGKYTHAYHFQTKADTLTYAKAEFPDLWEKTSIAQVGWYLENWRDVPSMYPKRNSKSGAYEFQVNVPADLKVPLVATKDDLGPCVKALLDEDCAGKNLIVYREYVSVEEMARTWGNVLNVPVKVNSVKLDINSDNDMVKELSEGYAFWEEFGYEAREDESVIHPDQLKLKPQLGSVKDWIAKQDWKHVL